MRLDRGQDKSFSIRMTGPERAVLDKVATKYDRPRGWVIRKFIRILGSLEKTASAGALNASEKAALDIIRKGMAEHVNPSCDEEWGDDEN